MSFIILESDQWRKQTNVLYPLQGKWHRVFIDCLGMLDEGRRGIHHLHIEARHGRHFVEDIYKRIFLK